MANAPPVIILGYDLWQRKFNGDRNIIGKTVRISRQETAPTVIGVMPPAIRFLPSPRRRRSQTTTSTRWSISGLRLLPTRPGRNNPCGMWWGGCKTVPRSCSASGTQHDCCQAGASRARLEGMTAQVKSLTAEMNRDGSRILLPLLGAAALVLLIACGNAAALLLVRGLGGNRIRGPLRTGSRPSVALPQVCTESLLLAFLAPRSAWAWHRIVKVFKLMAGTIPRLDAVTTGWPVLLSDSARQS